MTKKKSTSRIQLRAADSFDLIRLIARSQSDPRKAVAELVQNSLDAGATEIRITWFTHQKLRAISIYDNGEGVFPHRDRAAALRRLATTVGHSHKARLTPEERHRQMTLGKYGIGLLGFWSVGRRMEIRSRVDGSGVWVLEMEEEAREARVRKRRTSALPLESTMTEVVITHIHAVAATQIVPRRLAAFLAGELRGQLLERETRLEIYDRVGRGRTQKRRVVRPQRYRGIHIPEVREQEVEGFAPARIDLYLIPESEERVGRTVLACGGATVLDDISLIDGVGQARAPWSTGRFEGVVDFPDLTVAPSSRRGLVPDEAAGAFLAALHLLEIRLEEILREDAERRRRDREADDAKRLRRLFRRIPRALPDYAFFAVGSGNTGEGSPDSAGGTPIPEGEAADVGIPEVLDRNAEAPAPPETEYFYPPGPLAAVEIRPNRSILAPGGERRLRAHPRDDDGRAVAEGIEIEWSLDGPGRLTAEGDRAVYSAPDDPADARAGVVVRQGTRNATADCEICVTESAPDSGGRDAGIPDPEPVEAASEDWRSRLEGGRWQYNTAHPDYLRVRDDRPRRLNYLVLLFAKELVLRNFGEPGDWRVLERMVQVLTFVEEARRGR